MEEEHDRISIMRITIEHAGPVLIYMDECENPLRYALHFTVDDAKLQAYIEYGVTSDAWEALAERLPWKDKSSRRSRRSCKR